MEWRRIGQLLPVPGGPYDVVVQEELAAESAAAAREAAAGLATFLSHAMDPAPIPE